MNVVEILDDRERLCQDRAIFEHQSWHQALWVDREISRVPLLALAQVMGDLVVRQSLQVERGAQPDRARGAEIVVEDQPGHASRSPIVVVSVPSPSISTTQTSPGTSAPTPAGVPV